MRTTRTSQVACNASAERTSYRTGSAHSFALSLTGVSPAAASGCLKTTNSAAPRQFPYEQHRRGAVYGIFEAYPTLCQVCVKSFSKKGHK